jgi:hypothetical protein
MKQRERLGDDLFFSNIFLAMRILIITVNTGIKEIKEQYNKRIFYIIYKVKNPFIILFFYIFYSGIYGNVYFQENCRVS